MYQTSPKGGFKEAGDSSQELDKLSGYIVKQAACKLKPKKVYVSEGCTSDALLNGPDVLFSLLAAVSRFWLEHGTVTSSLLACAFLPLLTNSLKNPADVSFYRLQSYNWIIFDSQSF